MNRRSALLVLAGAVLPAGAQAQQDIVVGDLVLSRPWTRATPGGARVGGGYVTITNRGGRPDRLISGTLEVAGRVEIHEMATVDGVMRMRNLAQGLVIPPGGTIELRPGGYHAMFLDLTRPLRQGESLRGTLVFERAGAVNVIYDVGAIGAGPQVHHGTNHGQQGQPQHRH